MPGSKSVARCPYPLPVPVIRYALPVTGHAKRTTGDGYGQQPNEEEEHHRSDECNEDHSAESPKGRSHSERPEQPSTDECSAYADDDVTDESESGAAHHE
jgi:hypothetical protein